MSFHKKYLWYRVRWVPGFDASQFALFRAQGILQTSIDTVRKSLDGKEGLLKVFLEQYPDKSPPPGLSGFILGTYDNDELVEWWRDNGHLYDPPDPSTFVPVAMRVRSALRYPVTTTKQIAKATPWWVWLTGAVAVGGGIAWYLLA